MTYALSKTPNLFVIGAPKCGTTSLMDVLRNHKSIFVPAVKEPNHYNSDHEFNRYRTEERYLDLYRESKNEKYRVDGSIHYCYSHVAISRIISETPDPKFIFMVRNPYDMVVSWHSEVLLSGQETVKDFSTAWNLSSRRRKGTDIPAGCLSVWWLDYHRIASIGKCLNDALSLVGSDRLHIIVADDVVERPKDVIANLFEFLGLPDDESTSFPHLNIRSELKFQFIMGIFTSINSLARKTGVKTNLRILKSISLMTRRPVNALDSGDFHSCLSGAFDEDIDRISKILNRDLSSWKR